MVKIEDLFKREIHPDTVRPLIDEMNRLSDGMEYEKAQDVLRDIKEEMKGAKSNFPFNIETVKDVNDLIEGGSIRLDPGNYKFADYLGLLVNVHSRKNELKGMRYSDVEKQRKVVAEEMACLGMSISVERRGKKPNRAFLDVAHKINPFLACKEIERREKVMMWKAIESGKREEIEKARERLRKYIPKI